jgi:hypothetical protein
MSIDAVRAALVTLVKTTAKTTNVYGEDEFDDSAIDGDRKKIEGRDVRWWVVSVDPAQHAEGIGWHDPVYKIKIVGTYGRDRKVKRRGVSSDRYFRNVFADVVDALTTGTNRRPGAVLDTTTPRPSAVLKVSRQVGGKLVACHEATIEYEAQEE